MISFYITCHNRLDHLRVTLPRNLRWAKGCEFVVVNWGGDIEAREFLEEVSGDGRVIEQVPFQEEWDLNSARNEGWNSCHYDIRISLDADNWIANPELIPWILAEFKRQGPHHYLYGTGKRGHHGRIGAHVEALEAVDGWPEEIPPGAEDVAAMVKQWQSLNYTSTRWPAGMFGVIDHEVRYG